LRASALALFRPANWGAKPWAASFFLALNSSSNFAAAAALAASAFLPFAFGRAALAVSSSPSIAFSASAWAVCRACSFWAKSALILTAASSTAGAGFAAFYSSTSFA
jgi:hypothetical protein